MKIAVCIKSVPDPDYYDQIRLNPETGTLIRAGIPAVTNAADRHALELALTLKEQEGGSVTVLAMGPQGAKEQLLECLGLGADEAFLLCDRGAAGSDTLATSYLLSRMLKQSGPYDLILAGNESADGATAHVPTQIGEWLQLPHAANVCAAKLADPSHLQVKRAFDDGILTTELPLPCVAAVTQRINTVRYMNMREALKAKNKPITVWSLDDLQDLDRSRAGLAGSPTKNGSMYPVEAGKHCTFLEGSDDEIAGQILDRIQTARQ